MRMQNSSFPYEIEKKSFKTFFSINFYYGQNERNCKMNSTIREEGCSYERDVKIC